MSSPLVRCFWAIRPPDECLEHVGQLVRALKQPLSRLGLQVAWTAHDAYHLTLKFLGDVDEGQLGAMVAQVQTQLGVYRLTTGLGIGLGGLGAFPGLHQPRVFYVEAQAADLDAAAPTGFSPELQTLQARLADWLAPLGYARDERPFHPHLTLGRVRSSARAAELPAALPALLQRHAAPGPAFTADTLILYESQPAASGRKYTPLARLPLAAPAAVGPSS